MDFDTKAIITETRRYAEARILFACGFAQERNKKKPDFHKLAGAAFAAAEAFEHVGSKAGQMRVDVVPK